MVGANPDCVPRKYRAGERGRTGKLRLIALGCVLALLSPGLIQCGKGPSDGLAAANVQAAADTFDDRFPAPHFKDRFPTARESFVQHRSRDGNAAAVAATDPASNRIASLTPQAAFERAPVQQELTTLVSL